MLIGILKQLQNTSATLKKIKIIQDNINNDDLKKLFIYTYSHKYIYNIKVKNLKSKKLGFDNKIPLKLFDKLITCKGTINKKELIQDYINGKTTEVCKWVERIINKDLKININKKIINRAYGYELVPDFQVMKAWKYEEKRFNIAFKDLEWCYFNIKIDGIRCIVDFTNKDIKFISLNGLEMENFLTERIREQLEKYRNIFDGLILDTELCNKHFQKLMRIVQRKHIDLNSYIIRENNKLNIFDIINYNKPLIERVKKMNELKQHIDKIDKDKIIFLNYIKVKNDITLLTKIAKYYIDMGQEGIIIKNPYSYYETKRSNNWLKFKNKDTYDLVCTGYYEGEGKYKGMLGGLILNYNNNELRCGSGFTDDERKKYWKDRNILKGKVVEISFMEITKTGSIRHPVFERFREDKE